jgi:pyruvate,water dikinase
VGDVIRLLGELTVEEQPLAGGKGGTLARLLQAGYRVPDGFVIMPDAFNGDALRGEAWEEAQAHLAHLRRGDQDVAFAVRSSGLSEDSARASFAGEFETVLDVRTEHEVREAVHSVRRSRHSERVHAYRAARGLEESAETEVAVLVQRLVRADMSGVLFTADPVSGSRVQMTGQFVEGLGDGLVSGEATGRAFTLKRAGRIWPRTTYNGPPDLRRFARRLYRLGRRLEQELGSPQDIEWAIAGGRLFLLQSRPITTLTGFDPLTGQYNATLTGDYVWSSANIGEALSVVMTPYTWSAVRRAYDELNPLPGYSAAGNIGGRAYQNATVMAAVTSALGLSVEGMSQEIGGVRDEYLETMDQYLEPLPGATLFAVLPGVIRMWRKQREGLRDLDRFLSENPGWCSTMRRRIEAMENRDDLTALMEEVLEPRMLEGFWRTAATVWRYGQQVGKLRRQLIGLVGAADADVLLTNVSRGDEPLVSLGPVVGLARVARGELSREAYLEQWGHRGPLESEVSVPRPAEDPEWLDRPLDAFARSPVDVDALLAARRAAFDATWRRFAERYPRRAKRMRRRLDRAAEAACLREAVRCEFTRQAWVSRTWALRVGELTGIGGEVFFLTYEEVLDLLAGDDGATASIPARRETHERYKALPPYPPIIRGRFDPFEWAANPSRRSDVFDSHGLLPQLQPRPPRENVILGMPGSAGRAEGVVRRLESPEEGGELEPGEILVTSRTNVGWTLIFPRAGAVVTDVGAPISHAAIVARELGIPAVVNCGDATTCLRTGDRVLVDGVQGEVEILGTVARGE